MQTGQTSEIPDAPKLPPRPEKPDPSHCCNRGCERCIFVYYEEALVRWKEKIKLIQNKAIKDGTSTNIISSSDRDGVLNAGEN